MYRTYRCVHLHPIFHKKLVILQFGLRAIVGIQEISNFKPLNGQTEPIIIHIRRQLIKQHNYN